MEEEIVALKGFVFAGPLVRAFSSKDIYELYTYRAVLEGMAIRLAVQNASIKDIRHLEQFYSEMKLKLHTSIVLTTVINNCEKPPIRGFFILYKDMISHLLLHL